jgi:hypothetical protein
MLLSGSTGPLAVCSESCTAQHAAAKGTNLSGLVLLLHVNTASTPCDCSIMTGAATQQLGCFPLELLKRHHTQDCARMLTRVYLARKTRGTGY